MSTKNQPSALDGYLRAASDEPYFCLLARDASAPALIEMWATDREKHGEAAGVVAEARECAEAMRAWRDHNRPDTHADIPELQRALIQGQRDRITHLEEALRRSEDERKTARRYVGSLPGEMAQMFEDRQDQAERVANAALMHDKQEQAG